MRAQAKEESGGTRILAGRYKLVRLVGHGGMGSVYEAIHVHTQKRVAVKLLSTQLSKDLKLVARFRREALAAGRLEHENCVHVDDFDQDADGTFYIAMEFVEGHGLADELRKSGPMPPERVARLAVQLLKALDVAHSSGVLHRDLKPQNVMLTNKPQKPDLVKVVDFGIAKIITNTPEDQGALTVPGTIFGTPEYMSPEQARGETLDQRSDLYSAAVVLWHMLLGRSPFRGTSVRETLMKVFSEEPPSPLTERPTMQMPPGFEAVLRRAMAKRKEDRYPDAASFLEALRPYVTGLHPEVPRRPLQGMPTDGSAPPQTLDDARSATLALPEAQLAPLATPPARPLPQGAVPNIGTGATPADATRYGALPQLPPEGGPAPAPRLSPSPALPSPKVLGIGDVRSQTGPMPSQIPPALAQAQAQQALQGPPSSGEVQRSMKTTEPQVVRRKKKLSQAAVVVLSISALGAVLLAGAVVTVLYLVSSGFFDKKDVVVVDNTKQTDKVTNVENATKKEQLDAMIGEVPVDPIARDAAIARGKARLEKGDMAGARKAYDDAVAADPGSADALKGLATTAWSQKDWAAACDAFEKLMALDAKYERQFKPMYARARAFRDAPQ